MPFNIDVPKAVAPMDGTAVDVSRFSLSFGSFSAQGSVQGTLGEQPKLHGEIESNSFDLRALLASVGVPLQTTDPAALGSLQFTGGWQLDAGGYGCQAFQTDRG